jgi:YVTN family beta-propeller protein
VATVPVGAFPAGIAVDPTGSRVYVAIEGGPFLSVIDTSTNSVSGINVGSGQVSVTVNPSGTRVYATAGAGVTVIDTASKTVIATIPAGLAPAGIAINPSGTRVYVVNQLSNNVSVMDTSTNTVVATVGVGVEPWGFGQFIVPPASPPPTPIPGSAGLVAMGIAGLALFVRFAQGRRGRASVEV